METFETFQNTHQSLPVTEATSFRPQTLSPVIALLTDFGDSDGFVGIVKGVISSICPNCIMVDVAHHIPPQDINHAGWVLAEAMDHFPDNTIFVSVVDPHVGYKKQEPMLLEWQSKPEEALPGGPDPQLRTKRLFFINPNNGLLSRLVYTSLAQGASLRAVALTESAFHYERNKTSQTFHGRDIYAPVAANLANALRLSGHEKGFTISNFGSTLPQNQWVLFSQRSPQQHSDHVISGDIEIADTFGNAITNIPNDWVPFDEPISVEISIPALSQTMKAVVCSSYSCMGQAGETAAPLTLIPGSHGCVELAVFQSNALTFLGLNRTKLPTPIQIAPVS